MKYKTIIETDDYRDFEFFEDGDGKYLQGVDANAENGEWIYLPFKALEQEPRWIPVSERLPEIGQNVIATVDHYHEGLEVRETIYGKHSFLCGNVVAWMPLPEPYKAESEEV